MGDKTDIQALTEQMQVLTSSIQDLSKNVAEIKSSGVAANTTQVIRPSDFSVKVSLIPAAVVSFIFSAMPIALFTSFVLNIKNDWLGVITILGSLACSYFFTKFYYKHLATKPIVNIENLHKATV